MPERKPWVETPLLESRPLSKAAGCRIFLKLETLQPSGSFKSRGLGHFMQLALSSSPNPSKVHFYSSSGGNAGLACVEAARFLSRPATVVVPQSTKPLMIAKIRAAGAKDVLQHGATWRDADTWMKDHVMAVARRRGEEVVYVSPFDHPDIWEGHATMVDEIRRQFGELEVEGAPDAVVCSVGGGGLFCGIVQGLEKVGWKDTTVLAMNTVGANALHESVKCGRHITLPGITSQATSLGATRVGDRTFELATTRKQVKTHMLTDAEAAMGAWRVADDERVLVELACGVNTALCYGGRLEKALGRPVSPHEKIVIILCGGNNVTVDMISKWKQEFADLNDATSQTEKQTVPSAAALP